MIVTYLDLKTGQKATETDVTVWSLTEGNWSCDCNRIYAFGIDNQDFTCLGCFRFIAVDVQPEGDEQFDATEVLRLANSEYYQMD